MSGKFALRKLRERTGLSQDAFAKKVGVTQALVSKVETGRRGVSRRFEQALVRAFPEFEGELISLVGVSPSRPDRLPNYLVAVPIVSQAELASGLKTSSFHVFVPRAQLGERSEHELVAFRVTDQAGGPVVVLGAYVVVDINDTHMGDPMALLAIRATDVDISLVSGDAVHHDDTVIGRIVWVGRQV